MQRIGLSLLVVLVTVLSLCQSVLAGEAAGIVQMNFDLSHHPRGREVRLWIPYPVSGKYQDISAVRVSGDYAEAAVYADRKYRTPILYARWAPGAAGRKLALTFSVLRKEVQQRDLPQKEAAWDPADYRLWLVPTSKGPIDGAVARLAARITRGKSGVLAKARAIYDWICDNMYRDPKIRGCGTGNVCLLLRQPGGKCTDIHSVFVALCRAAGVPAREIFGIRLGKAPVRDITGWQHCWAEFFLPGHGWVPVDPADVLKLMLKKGLKTSDPEAGKLRSYFWGGWDPWRVELARGRDLVLNPPQKAKALNTFGYPYAEVDGKPLDFYDPQSLRYSFTSFRIEKDGYGVIDTAGLKALLGKGGDVTVFDARSLGEYKDAHLKAALNLPVVKFDSYAHLLPADKSRLLVFYCNGVKCGKSRKAARKALALGHRNVLVYAEGIPVWEAEGLPIEAAAGHEKQTRIPRITPSLLSGLLREAPADLQLIDVRQAEVFAAGHIPGAVNIPLEVLKTRAARLARQKQVVVYCNSGARSYKAYRILEKMGFGNIRQAIFADWKEQGFAIAAE